MDKLKGLKVSTNESSQSNNFHNPLSPETSDVAVGSFGSFAAIKGTPNPSTLAAKPAQPPGQRKMAAQRPPESFAAQQRQQGGEGMGSLNAFASGSNGFAVGDATDAEDELFALPMSPRSPETTKSPFSFAARDTTRYWKGEKA